MVRIKQSLPLGEKAVVSIVGAGGKTSLMFILARELSTSGYKVLTTTTTKIFHPTTQESPATIISEDSETIIKEARSLLSNTLHLSAAAGRESAHDKLIGLQPGVIKQILRANLFDYILVEADGAARRSLKACASYEPVVPRFTDTIISVAGLDVIGKPLTEEWVFRSHLYSSITGLPLTQAVTEESIAEILLHDSKKITTDKASTRRVAFLNKADNSQLINSGKRITAAIEKKNKDIFQRIIIGALSNNPNILHHKDLSD